MPWAAAGAAVGAVGSIIGGSTAASASKAAADAQRQQYLQTRADLQPYTQAGTSVLPDLTSLATSGPYGPGGTNYLSMAQGMLPPTMTQDELVKTPGYQFNLSQGLQATQNAAAARGLGVSGAALKGAATYATGLADSTYQNQFNNAQQRFSDVLNLNTTQQGNLQNQFSRLYQTSALGENAGAQLGAQGTAAAAAQGNLLQTAGQTQGAGLAGAGNAISSGINNYLGMQAFDKYLSGSGAAGGYAPQGLATSPSLYASSNQTFE